jgi:hypothetical protein
MSAIQSAVARAAPIQVGAARRLVAGRELVRRCTLGNVVRWWYGRMAAEQSLANRGVVCGAHPTRRRSLQTAAAVNPDKDALVWLRIATALTCQAAQAIIESSISPGLRP